MKIGISCCDRVVEEGDDDGDDIVVVEVDSFFDIRDIRLVVFCEFNCVLFCKRLVIVLVFFVLICLIKWMRVG